MIAVDTNFLVYARREEFAHHAAAARLLTELSEGSRDWAIPWPCIYEYLRVVTHRRVFARPTPLIDALEDLDRLFDAPTLALLGAGSGHRGHMRRMLEAGRVAGNIMHDGHIAALLHEHGVREFWTTDKDFTRFPGIVIRNPFDADAVHETRVRYTARRDGHRRTRAAR